MDDLLNEFNALKISALSKSKLINEFVGNVTIGPNSVIAESKSPTIKSPEKPKTNSPKQITTKPNLNNPYGISPYKCVLSALELHRQQNVHEVINQHRQRIINFNREHEVEHQEEWNKQQQNLILQMQQQELHILRTLEQLDIDSSKENEKLIKYYQKVAERRKENEKVLKAKEAHHKQIIDKIFKIQQDFGNIYLDIIQILKECSDDIKANLTDCIKNLKMLSPQMHEVINKCKAGNIIEQDVNRCLELIKYAEQLRAEIKSKIKDNSNQQELVIAQQNQVEQAKLKEQKAKEEAANNANKIVQTKIESFVSKSSLKTYSELQLFLQKFVESYKNLLDDTAMKMFKFDCKKAINIPVNAISATSSDHLLDKYNKLHNLLSGKAVIIGDNQIMASKHPQGIKFSMDLLAKKFVLQGDLMISSNPDAAFCYASVIVALWNEFPEFGKLILAHFHKECPYLVPIYLPRSVEQSDEDYYKSLGYQYKDGVVEKQDKFLKRMNGIIRLYFAILIVKPKRGHNKTPHDITNGWKWLTSILNLEPRMDITATALYAFLEVAGSTMQKVYGKQFKKHLEMIVHCFMPMLKKCDSGGPVARLEVLFQDFSKSGCFQEPRGLLPNNFW